MPTLVALACVALGTLWWKRVKEKPQRPVRVWGFDISKQVVSTAAAHLCGLLIAILASQRGNHAVSECAWYFVAFAVDTSLGMALAVGLHTLVVRLCRRRAEALPASPWAAWYLKVAECGSYGTPPQWRRFAVQLAEWTSCVITARLVCGSFVIGLRQQLSGLAILLDRGFGRHTTLELVFVMLVCPLGMNLLQALLQDIVLKRKHAVPAAAKEAVTEAVGSGGQQQLAGDPNAFSLMVSQMLSPQNEQRRAAEVLFSEAKKAQGDFTASSLVALLRHSQQLDARALCAVLLRKVLTKDDPSLWPTLSPNVQALVKSELLNCVREEQDRSIVKKVCDTVSELAAGIMEGGGWPELLPFMFQCVQSRQPRMVEAALLVFAQLARYLADTLRQYLGTLHSVLVTSLGSPSLDVTLAAMRATSAFIQELEDPAERDQFQATVPAQLGVVARLLNEGEETSAQDALELLIEVAEAHPRFLRRHLTEVAAAMLQIVEAPALEDATRQLAAELLVTLCEAREKAPGMMRKLPQFIGRFFQSLLSFLLDIEDDPRWHNADSDRYESEGEGERYEFGQECLDRMALALGGNTVVPLASAYLPALLADGDWRRRHAALICLAQIAEGCVKVMTKNLSGLVDMCLQGLSDPHAKVRWAACQALGQLCTDLGPDLQEAEHARILPGLMAVMGDFSQPRVQAHAAAAVVNFSENCEQELLPRYLDALITALLGLLQGGQKLVQEGALTAMASVADCAKDNFIKFYDQVMPLLRHILENATDRPHALLRAKALECISLVGMAVGRARFREDAARVMQLMQTLQAQELDPDDPTSSYMLQAGARLCKCLGDEFLPYLGLVMPPLLAAAQLKPDVHITDAGSDADEADDDEEVETIYMGDRKISIRTSVLEEKATACNMLCCYADELKDGFYPYVEQVTGIMLPLLKFYFHEEVRQAAVQAMPELLRSAFLAAEKGRPGADMGLVKRMLDFIWPPIMEAMAKEPDMEVLASMLEAVQEIVDIAAPALLPAEQLAACTERLRAVLAASGERRAERHARRQAEDFDAEEAEALAEENEDEEDLLDQLASVLTAVLRKYGDSALPFLAELMPALGALLEPGRDPEERRIAICILDDILEHCPAGSVQYMSQAVPVLLEGCRDRNANVRQCSVYGLGVLAEHRPEHFRPIAGEAVARMLEMLTAPGSRGDEAALATENAVAALGRVLERHGDAVDGAAVGSAWLAALPLVEDRVEARVTHAQLVRLVEASDARVLGQNNRNLAQIVIVLGTVLSRGHALVDPADAQRMVTLLQQMQSSLPPQVMSSLFGQLKPKELATLQAAMAGQSLAQ
ncbi:hypothetical protein WJX81_003315 [Elliptochloris bilobata]|uniref:TOG domain-containing protein n=1 Tax=Elliptochloris bilobata TaxID=381761 RepID=A0AAW1QJW2_9CHLO